jgi:aminopeptidase
VLKEQYLEKYADVLLWGLKTARRERFRKKDVILIHYDRAALRLAEILYDHIIPAMEHSFFRKVNRQQLVFQAPGVKELCGSKLSLLEYFKKEYP